MPHFTFPDGALGYDCVRCGSRCCKGLGFALTAGELVPLLARAPELAPFLQLQNRGVSAFDLADGCWLLAGDGRCGLEVEHGRAAKPSVCRIFPLKLVRVGEARVADVQLLACPVQSAGGLAGGPGSTVMRHAELDRELDELVARGADGLYGEAALPAGAPDGALAGEAKLRDAVSAELDDPDPAAAIARVHGLLPAELGELWSAWRRFFAPDAPDEVHPSERAVAAPFLLALGPLRFAALTAPGVPPWPRAIRALPRRLLAGAFLAALSARAGRAPSLRGIAEVWRSTPLVRSALAGFRSPATLSDQPAPPTAPAELAAALDTVREAAARSTLGDALAALTLAPPLRPLLLRLISERI